MNKWTFILALVLLLGFQWFYYSSNKSYKPYTEQQVQQPSQKETENENDPFLAKNQKKLLEEQKIENFYFFDAKKQTKELELWSKVGYKAMGSSIFKLDSVKVQFYSENVTYTVHGDKGQVDEVNKDMMINGNVKLNSSNDYLFYTDNLKYVPDGKHISTDDKVSLEGPKEKDGRLYLEGHGLDVNMMANVMVMRDRVSGYKPMSDGRVMKISSQMAEFSAKKRSVAFKNNVVIKVDKMVVRGNLATFQYKDGRLDTLYMDGGIHMLDVDKSGSAGEAIVYFNEDKYIFRKKPFITQNENGLIGDEIIVYNGGKRVQVKNAKIEYYQYNNEAQQPNPAGKTK